MMKKAIASAAIGAAMLGAMAIPAFASNSGNGSDYGTMPGYNMSTGHTICADHGSFNYFGKDRNLGNDVSGHYPGGSYPGPGAKGTQTGINNSHLCGNPQN